MFKTEILQAVRSFSQNNCKKSTQTLTQAINKSSFVTNLLLSYILKLYTIFTPCELDFFGLIYLVFLQSSLK